MAVVSPAGPCKPDVYRAGVDILASRYKIVHGGQPPAGPFDRLPYLADSDEQRADELNRVLADQAVGAIFFARGGYGSVRILDRLDADALRRRRLPLIGFSDITAIHAWAALHGVPTVHGPVVSQLSRLPQQQVRAMFHLLEGRQLPGLRDLVTLAGGRVTAPLWGGNLTMVASLCGTSLLPDLTGRILLLEEVNEPPYRLDRLFTQLRLAGVLHQVAGVVVGQMLEEKDAALLDALLLDRLGDLGIPVVRGAPVGHGDENLALPLGPLACLDTGEGTLAFSEAL